MKRYRYCCVEYLDFFLLQLVFPHHQKTFVGDVEVLETADERAVVRDESLGIRPSLYLVPLHRDLGGMAGQVLVQVLGRVQALLPVQVRGH